MSHVIAIDAGTGSVRAVLFDAEGRPVTSAARDWHHDPEPGVPGSMGFAVERNYALVVQVLREVLAASPVPAAEISAVSATSMREGIVVLDAQGRELWACANVDARAGEEVAELAAAGDVEKQLYSRSGQTFALAAQPRLRWLARHRPDLYDQAATVLMLSEWVLYRLCGELAIEPSNGSTSGLLALATRQGDPDLATLCGLRDDLLPPVRESGAPLGTVHRRASADTWLSTDTLVVVGGGDAQMATLGTGLADAGEAMIIAGTFWQQEVNIGQPLTDPQMRVRVNAAAVPGMWQAEAIAFHAGTAVRWFRDTFAGPEVRAAEQAGRNSLDVLTEAAAEVPVGADGIIPIFSDVMNYRRWKHAAPSFLNLSLDGGPRLRAAMFRSLLENAAIVADANLAMVAEFSGTQPEEVVFAGGSAKSKVWAQIVADVVGRPLRVPAVTEATAHGTAACAASGAGLYATPAAAARAWVRWDRTVEPSAKNNEAYASVKDRWRRAYAAQRTLMEEGLTVPMWQAPGT
ncbi:autoinducer-2 kinase [Georgenia daeguensis]|uniref:Autoinducer-2 kinase n=1 Tax=Georgenia daeguensis TaxID=908355 RepID=A0ABP8EYM6_9MICO